MTSPIIGCRWGFAPERETLSEAVKRENGFRLWEDNKFARSLRRAYERMVRNG